MIPQSLTSVILIVLLILQKKHGFSNEQAGIFVREIASNYPVDVLAKLQFCARQLLRTSVVNQFARGKDDPIPHTRVKTDGVTFLVNIGVDCVMWVPVPKTIGSVHYTDKDGNSREWVTKNRCSS
jgi:hypothetical protein